MKSQPINKYKYLWLFMMLYSIVAIMSNWFDSRLILIFGHVISPGTIVFPFTFLISDIITEVYGPKNAMKCIGIAFLFNLSFIAYGQIVISLPSPDFAMANNQLLEKFLHLNAWILAGSILSFVVSEPINSITNYGLKILLDGRFTGVRFITSTIIASGVDSFIFVFVSFARYYPVDKITVMSLNIWKVKVAVEIIGLLVSVRTAKKLYKIELEYFLST